MKLSRSVVVVAGMGLACGGGAVDAPLPIEWSPVREEGGVIVADEECGFDGFPGMIQFSPGEGPPTTMDIVFLDGPRTGKIDSVVTTADGWVVTARLEDSEGTPGAPETYTLTWKDPARRIGVWTGPDVSGGMYVPQDGMDGVKVIRAKDCVE